MMQLCRSFFVFSALAVAAAEPEYIICDHVAVGAGPAGVYYAWRLAKDSATPANTSICLFEQLQRVGGRVASITGSGPKADLVVEPGAYRFAPKKFCGRLGNRTYCVWTPVVAAVIEELQLKSRRYNPDSTAMDYNLWKIVDDAGDSAGFAQYVWGMLHQAEAMAEVNRLQIHAFLGHSLQSLSIADSPSPARASSSRQPITLSFRSSTGDPVNVAATQSVLLNLPQQPLLQVLAASSRALNFGARFQGVMAPPVELHNPNPAAYLKLYVHYSNAWWRGGRYGHPTKLNLTHGNFSNLNVTSRPVLPGAHNDPMHQFPGLQFPAPLEGSYHDGDVRCTEESEDIQHCRGYIQAHYSDDMFALMFYRSYGAIDFSEAFNNITRSSHGAAGSWLLDAVHASLVELHAEALGTAAHDVLHGKDTQPDHAVLAIWDPSAKGFGAACHFSRLQKPTDDTLEVALEVARRTLRPFLASGEDRVFVASEAFAPLQCWSEGALQMAENALQRLGVKKPTWMSDQVYKEVMFADANAPAGIEEKSFAKRHNMLPQLALHPLNMLVGSEVAEDNILYA